MDKNEAYPVIEQLLFKGFLVSGMDVLGERILLKTINRKEFDLIKYFSGDEETKDYMIRFDAYHFVYSIFAINGENILPERYKRSSALYEQFINLPLKFFSNADKELGDLRWKMYESLKFLEGYSYTDTSRSRWLSLCGNMPSREEWSGIPGTSELGLNVHQETWIRMNRILDSEQEYHKDFNLSAMIDSSNNAKGVKKMRAHYDTEWESLQRKRKELARAGYIDKKEVDPEQMWAPSVETREELVEELERQMEGKKDRHDVFMEKFLKKVEDDADKKTQEIQRRVDENNKKLTDVEFLTVSQRALTAEEMVKLKKRKEGYVMSVDDEGYVEADKKERFLKKINHRILTAKE